jgi:hypothetical protein
MLAPAAQGGSKSAPIWRTSAAESPAARRTLTPLPGGDAESFGMGPAVMLGQDLADVARPVGERAVADLAAGDRSGTTV